MSHGSTLCLSSFFSSNPTTRTGQLLLNKTIPTREKKQSYKFSIQLGGTPTTSNRRHFFSSNPTRRRHPQSSSSLSTYIGLTLIWVYIVSLNFVGLYYCFNQNLLKHLTISRMRVESHTICPLWLRPGLRK